MLIEFPIDNIMSFIESELLDEQVNYNYILDTVVNEAISYQQESNTRYSSVTLEQLKKIEHLIETEMERPLEGKRVRAKRVIKEILMICQNFA